MATKISRRKLAQYIVRSYDAGQLDGALREVAAYLLESHRAREVDSVVRAIEDEFAAQGIVIARVATAHPIDEALRQSIESLVNAREIHISESVDPSLMGGVCIETPGTLLDATIKRKLLVLRQAKI